MTRDPDSKDSTLAEVSITPYRRRYRNEVRDLLFHSYRMHSHLDWQETDQWLDTEEAPMRLAWAGGRLVGLMAVSAPLDHTCWIRLAAVSDDMQPLPILVALWTDLKRELHAMGITTVALLILRDWLIHYVGALGFHYVEDIVTLRRAAQRLAELIPTPYLIRPVIPGDVETIVALDQAAFVPPWQLALTEIRQATRMAAISTVALANSQIVGYQITTLYFDGGHLARLATLPSFQSQGVGSALLDDLLHRLSRRGVSTVTVNTQDSNVRSQQLYQRFGFERNGYDLPVWMIEL